MVLTRTIGYTRAYKGNILLKIPINEKSTGGSYGGGTNYLFNSVSNDLSAATIELITSQAIAGVENSTSPQVNYRNDLYMQGTTALRSYNGSVYYIKDLYAKDLNKFKNKCKCLVGRFMKLLMYQNFPGLVMDFIKSIENLF